MRVEAISGERGSIQYSSVDIIPTRDVDQIFSKPLGKIRALPGRRTHFPAGLTRCPIPHMGITTSTSKDLQRVTGFATEEQHTVATWLFSRLTQTLHGDPSVHVYTQGTPSSMRDPERLKPITLSDRILRQLSEQPEGQKDVAKAVKGGILEAYDVFMHLNGNVSTAMKSVFNYLASEGTRVAYAVSRLGSAGQPWPRERLPMDWYAGLRDRRLRSIAAQAYPERTEQHVEKDCLGRNVANEILGQVATVIKQLPQDLQAQYYVSYGDPGKKFRLALDAFRFQREVRVKVSKTADLVHSQMVAGPNAA